jgi:hypothetical protein
MLFLPLFQDGYMLRPSSALESDETFAGAKQFAEKDPNPEWPDFLKLVRRGLSISNTSSVTPHMYLQYAFPPSFEESVLLRDRH